ncbi:IS630 family transposase [Patescibacteria group bacterium]|nr:IS630 family transposase [Patescibacteria group bacterium]MBU1885514.1 IS630 family transposase [Patescibacteria group bacterium]
MLQPVQITSEEKELLISWYRYGTSTLIRHRAHTVLLNSRGLSAHKISQLLFRDYKTTRNWLVLFKQLRISSIFDRYRGNSNASKLTSSQKKEIKKVLESPPSDYGIPKEFWQVKDLKKWLKARFGVVYKSDRSYHFLFELSRFSWKLPDRFDVRRDDEQVEKRLQEIRKEIKPYLDSPDWVVLVADETRMMWETEARRTWLKTNEKTIIKVNRSRDYQSFLGSLNLKTHKCHLHSLPWQNQVEVLKALSKIKKYYPNKKICYIWDNAAWHKSKKIREALKKGNLLENFHLINTPPYAPDTNPVEHIWKYVKDKVAYQPATTFKQKVNNFKLAVIHRKFKYPI